MKNTVNRNMIGGSGGMGSGSKQAGWVDLLTLASRTFFSITNALIMINNNLQTN